MKKLDVKKITTKEKLEDSVVGYYNNGGEIYGGMLSKWAFNLLFGAILFSQGYTCENITKHLLPQSE